MTDQTIYGSINEEGLLKSLGPFRIIESDKSISGINRPNEEISKPLIIGELRIYGEKIVIEREIESQKT